MVADENVYVPGMWHCAKCRFTLLQSNLNAATGDVSARDQPGDKCPNDGAPLWRVTYKQAYADMMADAERVCIENQQLKLLLNTPELHDFAKGVAIEGAHQRQRWGASHDAGKTPLDWFWLIGYLAQKAADAAIRGDLDKAKHHTISTAAALANWHAALSGTNCEMRPGIDPAERAIEE